MKSKDELGAIAVAKVLSCVYANNPKGYAKILSALANGKPISVDTIAKAFSYPAWLLKIYLKIYKNNFDFNQSGEIIGAGLTLKPTKHHFTIRKNAMYTWCAFDTLLFPLMINDSAKVKTPCPITGSQITFNISPVDGITDLSPKSAVIAFVIPRAKGAKSDIRKSFCQFANAFKDKEAALTWQKHYPEALILPVDKAFTFSKMVVQELYHQPYSSLTSSYSLFKPSKGKVGMGMLGVIVMLGAISLLSQNHYLSEGLSTSNLIFSLLVSFFIGYAIGGYHNKQSHCIPASCKEDELRGEKSNLACRRPM